MVDFRKWLLALVAVGLLLGIGSTAAFAQGTTAFTCQAASGVPNILRAEGVTELVGDLVLTCTGGKPTSPGSAIAPQNVQVSINTNITSRIEDSATNASEALLTIDEPYPATGAFPPYPAVSQTPGPTNAQAQVACQAINNTNCAITSKNPGAGIGAIGVGGNYDGSPYTCGTSTCYHYNIFQGYQNGVNTIAWNGVPIDAPGTAGTRIIRITNVRANAFQLGVSSTLIPTQISMIVAVSGSTFITINQPGNGNVVGNIQPGLTGSSTSATYQQCTNLNASLLDGVGGQSGTITVTAKEGFAASFKVQDYVQYYDVTTNVAGGPLAASYVAPGSPSLQNIPGFTYVTESGLYTNATGLDQSGSEPAGLADHGTQIQFSIGGVGAGVSLFAPSYVYLAGPYGTGTTEGIAVLVSQVAGGGGAIASSTSIPVAYGPDPLGGGVGPSVSVAISGTTATLVYEIYYADPSVQESLIVPITAAWLTTGPTNPAPTTTPSTVAINFSPLSSVPTASSSAPIPRFGQPYTAANLYSINACSCNLLFPFVANIAGFDTGIAIANTSQDPYGTAPQAGTITLNYYGTTPGGGAAPAAQTTTSAVPAGSELIFDLSSGGNYGVAATPGFEGYIIAQSDFQYCHGFAYLSLVGAQTGGAEGYLAISLDVPVVTVSSSLPTGLNRTGNAGENEGH